MRYVGAMKTLLPLAAACAALSLGACATLPNGPIVNGGPVRPDGMAMIGQPTRVGALVVTPKTLVEDSRCPMNARCVWAGRVVVTARIDGAGWREASAPYGEDGSFRSVADIVSPDSLAKVREHKRAAKAAAKSGGGGV